MSPRVIGACALAFGLATVSASRDVHAGLTTAQVPSYSYADNELLIRVPANESGRGMVTWSTLGSKGKWLRPRKKRFDHQRGVTPVTLPVGRGRAHRVQIKVGGQRFELWTTRAGWQVSGPGLAVDQVLQDVGFDSEKTSPRDIIVDRGLRVTVSSAEGRGTLEVRRDLGRRSPDGPEPKDALPLDGVEGFVLVVGASVGALEVVLEEPKRRGTVEYRAVVDVTRDFGRYVIPLSAFRSGKGGAKKGPRRISSISISGTSPTLRGQGFEIDLVGFARRVYRVNRARMGRGNAVVTLRKDDKGKIRVPTGARIIFGDGTGQEGGSVPVDMEGRAVLESPISGGRYWMCHVEPGGADTCDPPDAPRSAFVLPLQAGQPVVIQNFASDAPENRFGRPERLRLSPEAKGERGFMLRAEGTGTLVLQPAGTGDWVEWTTPLPRLPRGLNAVELALRGTLGAESVEVSVVGSKATGTLNLSDYQRHLDPRHWDRVVIPLEAFESAARDRRGRLRRLGRPKAVRIRLTASEADELRLEIQRLRIISEVTPIYVARFEGGDDGRISLGTRLRTETRGGAVLETATAKQGMIGRGLRVTVRDAKQAEAARLIFPLRSLDAAKNEALSFAIRGAEGGEDLRITLRSGKKASSIQLEDHGRVTTDWDTFRVRFSDFPVGLDRRRLSSLELSWGQPAAESQEIWLDDISFQ